MIVEPDLLIARDHLCAAVSQVFNFHVCVIDFVFQQRLMEITTTGEVPTILGAAEALDTQFAADL